ncbi:CHAT domain-containing protein [Roseofilum casamattae]|uniref:CHAT domain-containing protein n=1 Tax=Roseofilum casamattae BLCC-M143 TaxID=3022442 RepID=A0ABT7C1T5_9CYAN|nr:CHAT domain-containing protein [Roseofilum casamattae]MDJ1185415.1 CHAT domain-containing protein [Roseofilum casamattae BLCC-M143]
MGDSIFRIRIQDKHDEHSWKVRAQLQQNRTLLEDDSSFHFEPEDFQRLKTLSLKDYGTYLGHALFQERLRDFFKSAFQSSQNLMKVALSVEVDDGDDAYQLRSLHWERLCVPLDGSWQYLALDGRLPFGYHVPMGNLDRQYSPIQKSNLRGLIVIANPKDLNSQYELAPIDVETTVQGIRAAFGDIPCDILANDCSDAVGLPTLGEVCDRLNSANPPYTLLHVISHGSIDARGNTILYWSDEQDRVEPIRGEYLVDRLRIAHNLPHLIFLCCCSSASYYGGLAQNLIQVLGTPTAIAMTDKVSIKTGLELARNFYPRLLKSGEVDVALQQAAAPLAERPDITVPCLFSYRINRSLFGIQDDIIGDKNYAVQIFASAASSTDGRIDWSQYRPSQEKAIEPYKFLSYYETSDTNVFFWSRTLIRTTHY